MIIKFQTQIVIWVRTETWLLLFFRILFFTGQMKKKRNFSIRGELSLNLKVKKV